MIRLVDELVGRAKRFGEAEGVRARLKYQKRRAPALQEMGRARMMNASQGQLMSGLWVCLTEASVLKSTMGADRSLKAVSAENA